MSTADFINGAFEALAGIFVAVNIRRVLRDRLVRGVSIWPLLFFSSWSLWNLYYYPSLRQWWSFAGGIVVLLANLTYAGLLAYFIWLEKRGLTGPRPRATDGA